MMRYFWTLFMVCITLPAKGEGPVRLNLSKDFCRKVITGHNAKNDVAYRGGVDVNGRAVTSATLGGFAVPLPTKIRIPISIQKQYVFKSESTGKIDLKGTTTSRVTQTTSSSGTTTLDVNEEKLADLAAQVPGLNSNSTLTQTLNALTLGQLQALNKAVTLNTTSTGTSVGESTGTTTSSGTITQSSRGTRSPIGTIKSPYVDEIPLGFVEYELESGKLSYNGKEFSSEEEAQLQQDCQKILENSEK